MEDKDKHINQMPDSNYPEPSVPAGNAWANMNDMLNQEMPATESILRGKNVQINSLKFISASIVLITAGIIFWNYSSDNNTVSNTGLRESNKNLIVEKHEETDIKKFEVNNNLKGDSLNQNLKSDPKAANPINKPEITEIPNNLVKNDNGIVKQKESNTQFNIKKSASNNALASAILNDANHIINSGKIKVRITNKNKNNRVKATDKNDNSLNIKPLSNNIKSTEHSSSIKLTGKRSGDKANTFPPKSANQFMTNEKALSADLNNFSKNPAEKQISISLLEAKISKRENKLKQKFESVKVNNFPVKTLVSEQKIKKQNSLLKDIHLGLQWNINIPLKSYDHYFTGANNRSNQFYTVIIPGIWIEKKLKNGNGIMLKLNPFSQYFGNNKEITSSTISSSDSLGITKITNATSIIKISGISGGVQYNQRIYDKLSIGIGANVYWQNRALLNKIVSDSAKIIMSDSLYSVKETSNEGKYLNLNFITANLEVLYTWRGFQFGGGIIVPITSMTGISDKKIRPVSGQLVFRWRLK